MSDEKEGGVAKNPWGVISALREVIKKSRRTGMEREELAVEKPRFPGLRRISGQETLLRSVEANQARRLIEDGY